MLNDGQPTSGIGAHTKTISTCSIVQELLYSYHRQAIYQANILFWFSMIAGALGLVLITYTIIMSSHMTELQLLLRSLSGTAIELVAGLFFRQAREVRHRATALFDRLRIDRQQTDAIALVESITDAKVKSRVKAHLAIKMVGISPDSSSLIVPLTEPKSSSPTEHATLKQG